MKRMTASEIDERICRGEQCPVCLAVWQNRMLIHKQDCAYGARPHEVSCGTLFEVKR